MTELLGTYVFSIYVKVSDISTKVSTYKAPASTTQSGYQVTNVWGDEGVTGSIPADGSRADFTFANPDTWYRVGMTITLTDSTVSQFRAEAWNSSTMYVSAPMLEAGDTLHAFVPYGGWSFHAAEGEYPINNSTLPKAPTNYTKPWANGLWRVDEGNDGYPYTELQLGVLHVDPGPTPPPPPPPEEHGIPIVQPDGTHIIDDETSMYYLRYMNGYTNPNLYRFRDGELPENTECDVFIKGTHSHRYTSINDYEDFSTECEVP
jgi:hypothetical protein